MMRRGQLESRDIIKKKVPDHTCRKKEINKSITVKASK